MMRPVESHAPIGTVVQGPVSSDHRSSSVMITRTPEPATAAKSAATARRIARPSASHDGRISRPARPPPVTHSCTRIVMQSGKAMRSSDFRVIPVLDLKAGRAVHAIRGNRSDYQPVRSLLHPSTDPEQLARAYRDVL